MRWRPDDVPTFSTSELVLDRLADILFASDEILDLMREPERVPDPATVQLVTSVQHVYDQVNELMKQLVD